MRVVLEMQEDAEVARIPILEGRVNALEVKGPVDVAACRLILDLRHFIPAVTLSQPADAPDRGFQHPAVRHHLRPHLLILRVLVVVSKVPV
jgi:hypothetical protein